MGAKTSKMVYKFPGCEIEEKNIKIKSKHKCEHHDYKMKITCIEYGKNNFKKKEKIYEYESLGNREKSDEYLTRQQNGENHGEKNYENIQTLELSKQPVSEHSAGKSHSKYNYPSQYMGDEGNSCYYFASSGSIVCPPEDRGTRVSEHTGIIPGASYNSMAANINVDNEYVDDYEDDATSMNLTYTCLLNQEHHICNVRTISKENESSGESVSGHSGVYSVSSSGTCPIELDDNNINISEQYPHLCNENFNCQPGSISRPDDSQFHLQDNETEHIETNGDRHMLNLKLPFSDRESNLQMTYVDNSHTDTHLKDSFSETREAEENSPDIESDSEVAELFVHSPSETTAGSCMPVLYSFGGYIQAPTWLSFSDFGDSIVLASSLSPFTDLMLSLSPSRSRTAISRYLSKEKSIASERDISSLLGELYVSSYMDIHKSNNQISSDEFLCDFTEIVAKHFSPLTASISSSTENTSPREKDSDAYIKANHFLLDENEAKYISEIVKRFMLIHTKSNYRGVNAELPSRTHGMLDQNVSQIDSDYFSLLSLRSDIITKSIQIQDKIRDSPRTVEEVNDLNKQLRHILKAIEPEINVTQWKDNSAFVFPGLQGYFDSLRNGVTPSLEERMTYEWLRLISYSTYTGGGSPVHLARSGFYHAGSNETRCFSCNVSHSNWTYTDNLQEIHRRISPNCALVNGENESSGNISIESGDTQNQTNQAAESSSNNSSVAQAAAPATAGNHGEFSFSTTARSSAADPSTASSNPPVFRFPQNTLQQTSGMVPNPVDPPTASAATAGGNSFSFGAVPSTQSSSEFRFHQNRVQQSGGASVAPQLTNQLQALTIQQSSGVQQPSDEPVSGNPVIAPTQPLQIARQADGDAQLTVSAHHQPESNEIQLSTGNQRSAEASRSIDPEAENADNIQAQLNQVKHPNYTQMAVRMSSFSSWPNYLNQTPRQMAYAGFFHPGIADFARCFCCGGGLRNWEADDDPMVEHARWYPRCEYINRLKGTHFVQAVLRRHREHVAERQREREAIQNTYSSPDPMTTSVAANLLEMGFTEDRAREAIFTVRRLRGRSEVSVEEVMTWMLDDDNSAGNQLPTNTASRNQTGLVLSEPGRAQPSSSSSSSSSETAIAAQHDSDGQTSIEEAQGPRSDSYASSGELEGATGGGQVKDERKQSKSRKDNSPANGETLKSTEGSSSEEKYGKDTVLSGKKTRSDSNKSPAESKSKRDKKTKRRKGQSPAPAEGAESMPPGSVDTKSLKEENKFLKQMQVCKICMDKYVSITFLPCGHLVCCEDCAKNMKKCPICRKRIKGQVRTFMS